MMDTWERLSGWLVKDPDNLRSMPETLDDLLTEEPLIEVLNFVPHDFYATREDAMQALRGYLTAQREQALKDTDFLSRPYTSPNGITYICPEHLMVKWRAEARHKLQVAERGLQLCG